ncbi:MAG: helix-turn-helix transcriptional regulator [Deltaproteobacteria bacterium]|nr:helix-turn-helix transcriptional regulator [Deltaproteobacteria bacterium]
MADQLKRERSGTSQSSHPLLTEREKKLLCLVSAGATSSEVAAYMSEKSNSIENDISIIFQKIGVPNRFQAALWAGTNL